MRMFVMTLAILGVLLMTACSSSPNLAPRATESLPGPSTQDSYLEKVAKGIAIRKDEDGHLLVEGNAGVQFARLLAYFNAEAKSRRDEGDSLFYKVSGFYAGATGGDGYTDAMGFRIQVSSDDFSVPVDLAMLAQELGIVINSLGNLNASAQDPYAALDALLTYRNAEAANLGREYKIKAWYERYEQDGVLVSDRLDIMIYFSFAEKLQRVTPDLAISARSLSAVEERQKSIIAMVAVDFSQLLQKSGELNVVALDFSGDNDHGPETAYVFEGKDIGKLKEIQSGQSIWDKIEILSLAEVKDLRRSYISGDSLVQQSGLPKVKALREKEPVGSAAVKIVAYIAQESARVINPTSLEIIIYEFTGNAPKKLITWSYMFDAEDIKVLRDKELDPGAILKIASVAEQVGVIPGDRTIPFFKPIIK